MNDRIDSLRNINARCDLVTLDTAALYREIRARDPAGFLSKLSESHPHLFCAAPLAISADDARGMLQTAVAIEQIAALPAYQRAVFPPAADDAGRFDPGNASVFNGYDFHITSTGPRLIEINTNAGGAMLCLLLALAQKTDVPLLKGLAVGPTAPAQLEATFIEMFADEWRRAGHGAAPQCIAIVDDAPAAQYLYPEFLLFQRMFQHRGIQCLIVDPRTLSYHDGALWHRTQRVDLVYNRLTDFTLNADHLRALRGAYLDRAVVVTPNPRAHALFANKRNLQILCDADALRGFGVPDAAARLLARIVPRTVAVDAARAESMWSERKRWFFKPAAGYGGKAAYRGDKLTKRVWDEIGAAGHYVAQELVPPSERCVRVDGVETTLKVDVRCFAYRGVVQLVAARLYQGQTTNFRTPGGGFAPVYSSAFSA